MDIKKINFHKMVRPEDGLVGRAIFSDPDIYRQELEKVFTKCWLYLGHESQLPADGDFFTTYMGADSVIVTRSGGKVHAFLNSCTHRGMKVCRTDKGHADDFTCPYHGWCFSNKGELIGVPGMREAYNNKLDVNKWGLKEVAQLDTFGGLIFATWDPNAPTLRAYLGGMTVYLDRMLNRLEGGVEMIAGVQKWEMPTNWKLITENFLGDSYHVGTTHGSVVDIGFRKRPKKQGFQISIEGGHGFGSELGGFGASEGGSSAYAEYLSSIRDRMAAANNPADQFIPLGHGSVFPNLSFLDGVKFRLIRMSHPRGPGLTESHTMCFVDKGLPKELREEIRRDFILSFGPSGMFEVEDGEIWGEVNDSLQGHVSSTLDFNYQMGLGQDQDVSEKFGEGLPGRTGWYWSELNQREYYRCWRELMEAK
jgi:phenylpropionate dioxygenase-like ring-hydroxylating dioxygenase large terminal subunit